MSDAGGSDVLSCCDDACLVSAATLWGCRIAGHTSPPCAQVHACWNCHPSCRRLRLQAVLQVTRNQLAAKERQRDPVLDKPQLEQDRAAAVEKHYAAAQELVAMLRERWHAVRKRTALELGQREAEMQVRPCPVCSMDAASMLGAECGCAKPLHARQLCAAHLVYAGACR